MGKDKRLIRCSRWDDTGGGNDGQTLYEVVQDIHEFNHGGRIENHQRMSDDTIPSTGGSIDDGQIQKGMNCRDGRRASLEISVEAGISKSH